MINTNISPADDCRTLNSRDTLDIFYDRKQAKYYNEKHEKLKELYHNSLVGKEIDKFILALKKLKLDEKLIPDFNCMWSDHCLTKDELAKIDEINDAYNTCMKELYDTVKECSALLQTCQTFEQRLNILCKFNIIDENYRVRV